MTMHKAQEATSEYLNQKHDRHLYRETYVSNTNIKRREIDKNSLLISEALLIKDKNTVLNRQATANTRTLKLYSSKPLLTQLSQNNDSGRNNNDVPNITLQFFFAF